MASLPQYLMGQNQFDTTPLENGLAKFFQRQQWQQEQANKQRQLDFEAQRVGMDQQRLGFQAERQPYELAGLQLGNERARLENQGIPLQQNLTREQIAAASQNRMQHERMNPLAYDAAVEANRFARELHPIEIEAKRKSLQTDPLMVVPDGANVLNRNTGQYLEQPAGAGLNKVPEHVAKSAGFVSRMVGAEENVRRVMEQVAKRHQEKTRGFDPTAPQTAVTNLMPEALANLSVRDPEHQQYRQGAEMWIRAFLRKESGAAIGKDEFARDFVVYFPQPGDSKEVLAQKERARHEVMTGFYNEGAPLLSKTNPRVAERLNRFAPTTEITPQPQAAPAPQPSPQIAPPQPLQPQQRAIPNEAIQHLQGSPTPEMMRFFDEKYGPGAAKRALRMQ